MDSALQARGPVADMPHSNAACANADHPLHTCTACTARTSCLAAAPHGGPRTRVAACACCSCTALLTAHMATMPAPAPAMSRSTGVSSLLPVVSSWWSAMSLQHRNHTRSGCNGGVGGPQKVASTHACVVWSLQWGTAFMSAAAGPSWGLLLLRHMPDSRPSPSLQPCRLCWRM
jgi:hypothetical protein